MPEGVTERFRKLGHTWRDIRPLTDELAAEQIRADRIDVLIDTSLHMAENRLGVFARRPAPIQATFARYPGTTGLSAMDYRLTDPYLDPPGQADEGRYSERSARLAHSFWCYEPAEGAPAPNAPPV